MAGRRRKGDLRLVDASKALDERSSMLARQAYSMRQAGVPLHEIAEQLGLADSTVGPLVRRAMTEAADLVTEGAKAELLSMEVARLDALQRAVWPAAMGGDTRSVESALKVIAARTKLLGLDQAVVENIQQAVIVAGDTGAYIQALRGLVPDAIEEV